MCDLDVMGVPSKLSVIHKTVVLTRVRPTFLLIWGQKSMWREWKNPRSDYTDKTPEVAKSGQFPDEPVRIKVSQIRYVTSQTC